MSGGEESSGEESAPGLPAIRRTEQGLAVGFRVSPGTARTAVKGLYGERIKVSLSAPPEDGRANAELLASLARWMGLPRDNISLSSGRASRDKVVAFAGVDEAELRAKLAALLDRERARKKE